MCGRFSQTHSAEAIAAAFGLSEIPQWQPRYNIAPTQTVPAIIASDGQRHFKPLRWGLIPSWAKDPSIGARLINARAATLSEKPSFRDAFKRRRCLIVADGFYEWRKEGTQKQPFYFRLETGEPFAFAGLWEGWHSPDGDRIETCTIITTDPNELTATVHDRMPVILPTALYDRWLDSAHQQTTDLQAILHPYAKEAMIAYPVSTAVNRPTNDSPDCIAAIA
jgi:putative SOS response-associated peptidase YedK